jgi:hypothetical protein
MLLIYLRLNMKFMNILILRYHASQIQTERHDIHENNEWNLFLFKWLSEVHVFHEYHVWLPFMKYISFLESHL